MPLDEVIRGLALERDNYENTVLALKTLANALMWDESRREIRGVSFFGRSLNTSSENRISPSTVVTPDLVIRPETGVAIVAEGKLSLPKSLRDREERIKQIEKYDDDLTGWDTLSERVDKHDIALVVHHFRGPEAAETIRNMIEAQSLRMDRKLAVVCFGIIQQAETWLSLELLHGSLTDEAKDHRLRLRLPVQLKNVAGHPAFAHVRLYDAKPPPHLLMELIHEAISSASLSDEDFLTLREVGEVAHEVEVDQLRTLLSTLYGPGQPTTRVPEIPRREWVREAMQIFTEMDWADEIVEPTRSFRYIVKKRRQLQKQIINAVARHVEESRPPSDSRDYPGRQGLLFGA